MRKCVFGWRFHFHKTLGLYFRLEDPREMQNYEESSSFDVFSEIVSTSVFFFREEIEANSSKFIRMEGGLESIRGFSKGILLAFGVRQYFLVRGCPILKTFGIPGLRC